MTRVAGGRRNRGSWTPAKQAYLHPVLQVLDSLEPYWPLTLRQVYYQLVSAGHIPNDRSAYQKLSQILAQARLEGRVSWDVIEDRARAILSSSGWSDASAFLSNECEGFLSGYRRDLLQSQESVLEIWVEKDALSHVCHRASFPWCVSVVVARGFSSVSYVHDAALRIRSHADEGRRTSILYFGDLDPSGWEMLPSMLVTLQDEMGLEKWVEGIRCALTPDQVDEFNLPTNPDALKLTDSRAKRYMDRFGSLAVELDALPPQVLEALVRRAIEERLDLGLVESEREEEARERVRLQGLKDRVIELVEAEGL